jgi:mono/diheme cytochrome c family protein
MPDTDTNTENASPTGPVAGLVAQFESPEALVAAAAEVREAGFRCWDAHSPFPIHGLERAMGIRMTILPWLVLGAGITGGLVALVMQWWTNGVHYPLIISGKPLFSLPANIPVTFELIVLFSALTTFFGALVLSLLPQYGHPAFSSKAFRQVTTDGFFISIAARDPKFDQNSTANWLNSIGAASVETCFDPAGGTRLPGVLKWALAVLIVVSLVPPLLVARMRVTKSSSPRPHLFKDMDSQPKYKAQTDSPLFPDGRSNRPAVAGTVALGRLDDDQHLHRGTVGGEEATTFPQTVPLTMETMNRGQARFNIYCAPCHGLAGDGDGPVARRAQQLAAKGQALDWTPPTQLRAAPLLGQAEGKIFHSITNGVRKMPAYGSQISPEDRWAIIMYVRALQRSQTAGLEDIPEIERSKLP